MIKSMTRLWKDRRGTVPAITGAAIPLVVGAAGLATDTIQWVTWKRELQRAADSAAFAGAFSRAQNASLAADAAVARDLTKHNNTGISLSSGYPIITYPNASGWMGAVRVTLRVQKKLGFSSMFISSAPTITATGTAALIQDGWYCLYALEDGTDPGITVGGSSNAQIGCNANSNSQGDPSGKGDGNAYPITAPMFSGAGNMPPTITGVTEVRSYQMQQPDPFKDKYPTSVPPSQTCSNMNSQQTMLQGGQNKIYQLSPGCYNDSKFTSTNNTYKLQPGVYYLNNTDFEATGGTIEGTGVTIILTGTTPGSIQTNGNVKIQLVAPTSATCGTFSSVNSCDYEEMLFVQSSSAGVDNLNKINGSSSSFWDGKLYFPNGKVSFTGSTGATTRCLMVVAKKLDFSGNANIQNNPSDCDTDGRVPRYVIRLVG